MTKQNRVYKYGNGATIPKGAEYLTTLVEEKQDEDLGITDRFVWHYFLVEVEA